MPEPKCPIMLFVRPPKKATWRTHRDYSRHLRMLAKKLNCIILTRLGTELPRKSARA